MGLVLLNLQSDQEINLDKDNPFVIGRGFVTGCNDKRVSRCHGKITCRKDGTVSLVALHSNPCFFTRKGTPPVLQLNKNEEEVLNEGDCLGLLPNSYWYQITSKLRLNDAKLKRLNNLKLKIPLLQKNVPKTETIPKEEMMDLVEKSKKYPTLKHSESDDNRDSTPANCPELPVPSCSGESTNLVIPSHLRGTCKLPLWRYEVKEQKKLTKYANSPTKKVPDTTKDKHTSGTQSAQWQSTAGLASGSITPTTDKTKDKSPDEKKGCEDDSNDDVNASKSKPGRPYCQYDGDCYRKNVQHKLEYSHPGDEDYVEYENRPMCMYGAHCYRKNLLHRRQFRHVSIQDSQTSLAPEAPVATDDSDEAPETPVATADSTEAPEAPGATTDSTEAPEASRAPGASFDSSPDPAVPTPPDSPTPGASSKSSSKVKRKERKIKREPKERSKSRTKDSHKRKRHSENDRSPRSCRLSVTVSSRPKQKRRKNSQTGTGNHSSFYSSDVSFDDTYSSSDPFSDNYSSDDYIPTTDSDDFDPFAFYNKDYFRDYYF